MAISNDTFHLPESGDKCHLAVLVLLAAVVNESKVVYGPPCIFLYITSLVSFPPPSSLSLNTLKLKTYLDEQP